MVEIDSRIKELLKLGLLKIDPFYDGKRSPGEISRGLSSAGYDLTLANEFMCLPSTLFVDTTSIVEAATRTDLKFLLDPKDVDHSLFRECVHDGPVWLRPHGFVLARSVEYLHIPREHIGLVFGKSTYARCGLVVNATPLEPGWHGHVTLELFNASPYFVRLYPGEGIAQVLFVKLSGLPEKDYSKRGGVYQGQVGVTLPRVSVGEVKDV